MKKKIFIFCESDPNKEPRVIRTVEALEGKYEVVVAGYTEYRNEVFFDLGKFLETKEQVTFHLRYPSVIRKPISLFLNIFYYKSTSANYGSLNPKFNISNACKALSEQRIDLMICHGLGFLELCARLRSERRKLVLNTHEYYPSEFEDKKEWVETGVRYSSLLGKCAKQVDLNFCVNATIGKRYLSEFGFNYIEVVNAPDHESLSPSEVKEPIQVVHHGVALRNRKIELMIEGVMKSRTELILNLILVPTEKEYFAELKAKYADNEKVRFIEPVEVKQISKTLNQFDIGLFYLEPVNYNWLHALPNKLFEFVQARLAIVVSPNPEMKRLVDAHQLGWVTKDHTLDSLIETLNGISEEKVRKYKQNSDQHAMELSSLKVKEKMRNAVDQLCAA